MILIDRHNDDLAYQKLGSETLSGRRFPLPSHSFLLLLLLLKWAKFAPPHPSPYAVNKKVFDREIKGRWMMTKVGMSAL